MRDWLASHRLHFGLFVVGLLVFGATAGSRLKRQSRDPHFVYQADAWIHGRLSITPMPRGADDPARVKTVVLDDGSRVKGRFMKTRKAFETLGGDVIPDTRIVNRNAGTTTYVSFPPFPSVLLLPQVLIHGEIANDVGLTVFIAALVLPFAFAALRRLAAAGLSERTPREDLWLVAALAFGSVFYFSAVQGRVWYTAHVVGVALALAYVWCTIEARHPILAGLCLGCATMTRVPMAFMFPLFAFEAWRVSGGRAGLRRFVVTGAKFAAPILVIAVVAMIYNYARFRSVTEFGHSFLEIRQQKQIETYGIISHHFLSRNLAVALALLPDISTVKPYVLVSKHGLALWFTTPVLLLLLWPRVKNAWHRPLWITVALVAIPSLFYHNSGWVQFGYRFSLDYMVLLILLIAIGARPLGRVAKALIIIGVVVNLFGAVTFDRYPQFYRGSFNVVVEN